jgi:hypothetical protein
LKRSLRLLQKKAPPRNLGRAKSHKRREESTGNCKLRCVKFKLKIQQVQRIVLLVPGVMFKRFQQPRRTIYCLNKPTNPAAQNTYCRKYILKVLDNIPISCDTVQLLSSWSTLGSHLHMPRPVLGNYDGAVVSGFSVFGTRIVQWVSATVTVNVLKTLLHVSSPSSSPPRHTTVLQTLLRGRYLPAWKQRVTWYAQARGQFPNNPRCWSYLQAQGSTNVDMQKP